MRTPLIVGAQPLDEGIEFEIAPHPRRKALESGNLARAPAAMSHRPVDGRSVRPIGLDGYNVEMVPLDQPPRDCCPGSIEFTRAVARFAKKHDSCGAIAAEKRSK